MILIDNTVLSNFAIIRQAEAIQLAFDEQIGTTNQVYKELRAGEDLNRIPIVSWDWLVVIDLDDGELPQFVQLKQHLGRGEASCLAIASQRNWKIATDDKDARKWAIRLHIPHTGTLGVLGLLIKQNHLTLAQGNGWLSQMIDAGYRSPMKTLDRLVQTG